MSVETCWIPVLLWILCGSQLRWTHFDGFPWRDKPFGSMMSDFVGPCWLAHETCQGLYPVSTVCLSQELMMTWLDGGEVIKFHPFSHSKVIYIYIFTFFPVTRVLKVVIPIGCPVGPEVQTLGIFGSNPFYNLIQLIYIYICITLFPQPFQWGSLDLVSADPSPPPLLILILCPGLPAPNRTCPSNYASGERLNILYIHIYIYMCIFMDWGQCLRLWVCMVHL